MGCKITNKTKNGKMLYREIRYNDDVDVIEQRIISVNSDSVEVKSSKNKCYWVKLSDIVRMTMKVEIGDIAVIKTFPNGWLVTNIKKSTNKPDYQEDMDYEDLFGSY